MIPFMHLWLERLYVSGPINLPLVFLAPLCLTQAVCHCQKQSSVQAQTGSEWALEISEIGLTDPEKK